MKKGIQYILSAGIHFNVALIDIFGGKEKREQAQEQALLNAILENNTRKINKLFKKMEPNDTLKAQYLRFALFQGAFDSARYFIKEQGADFHTHLHGDKACLFLCVSGKGKEKAKMVSYLLEAGAQDDINTPRNDGFTLLHLAVLKKENNTDLIKVLLEKGANPNCQTQEGQTPLMLAALYNAVDDARLLIEAGARLDLCDKYGDKALDYMDEEEQPEMAALLKQALEKAQGQDLDQVKEETPSQVHQDAQPALENPSRSVHRITRFQKILTRLVQRSRQKIR